MFSNEALSPPPWEATLMGSFVLGIVCHWTIRPYEIDSQILPLAAAYFGTLVSLATGYAVFCQMSLLVAFYRTTAMSIAFNAGLFGSILLYRGFFHRLYRFPGPLLARFSKFWQVRMVLQSDFHQHTEIQKLHQQHGDFVRLGPREISINRKSAIDIIYGPGQHVCAKGPWYSSTTDDETKVHLMNSRNRDLHKLRKKVWEKALSYRALTEYEPRVKAKVDLLLSRLGTGDPVNMTDYAMFFGFDVMGDVGLSKDFRMLQSGTAHEAISELHGLMRVFGLLGPVPWLIHLLGKISSNGGPMKFIEWCNQEIRAKQKILKSKKSSFEDEAPKGISEWLIRAMDHKDRSGSPSQAALEEDSRLLIIAGSDTTSITLNCALYYLSKHPEVYRKLQEIIDRKFPNGAADWTYAEAKIPYLDQIIHETLRLKPPVPGGPQRVTPPEGLQVDDIFIPGDVVVYVPTYTIHRDPRYWENPTEFMPERWDALSTEKQPFMSFTRGEFSCPGRGLATMELRMALSLIALHYNLEFSPGENGELFDEGAKDYFTLELPALSLVFTPRKN